MKKLPLIVALALLLSVTGCTPASRAKAEARSYFDSVLQDCPSYSLGGITGYEVRAYEIVQTTGDMVIVRVTFASRLGSDLVETKKFRFVGERLVPTDRKDINEGIRKNLLPIWMGVCSYVIHNGQISDTKTIMSAPDILETVNLANSNRVNGEDYSRISISSTTGEPLDMSISVMDKDGEIVSYEYSGQSN